MKKTLISLAAFILGLCAPLMSAHALTISPARLEINGDPGQTISGEFLLTNEQEGTRTFYSSSENFEAQGETGTPAFVPGNDGLASWISVVSQVTLKKGQMQKVPFTIQIPKDADPGGHFAAVFLSTAPSNAKSDQVSIGAKVGVLILLRVSGDIKEGGGIIGFGTTDKGILYSTLPISFSYRFSNTGNDRSRPDGSIVIRDTIGLQAANIAANQTDGNVLPGSTRRFDVSWGTDAPLAAGAGFFEYAGYQWSHFAFGWYGATLNLTYGTASTASAHATVFVFPWQLLIIILVVLVVILFILSKGLKSYNRWIISKARGL